MLKKLSRKDIELLNALAQTPESKSALNEYIEQHEKAVKAYKVYRESVVAEVEVPNVEKSANELRAEIIEKAKEFVEKCRSKKMVVEGRLRNYVVDGSFIVIADKRTVVASLVGVRTGLVRVEGISKCNPDDVFNEHIGKAIALGRALNLDVSEFEQAVQPNEVVEGMVIEAFDWLGEPYIETAYKGIDSRHTIESLNSQNGVLIGIINDTNAQYKN